jgi:hypothetical protein
MEARWSHLGLRALKHDQLPNYPNLVETQYYVDTLVIAPNFKVAALDATPLVEILDHIDLNPGAKSSGHLDPAMAGIGLYLNLHVCAARDLLGPWDAYCFLRNKLPTRLESRGLFWRTRRPFHPFSGSCYFRVGG